MSTDPFGGGKTPSLKFPAVGTSYKNLEVLEEPNLRQKRDFGSGDPEWWDKEETQPKMEVVVVVEVDGARAGIYAKKPSALFAALADAQRAAGQKIQPGGVINELTYSSDKPPSKVGLHPAKQFTATYTPPTSGGAFGEAADDDAPPF